MGDKEKMTFTFSYRIFAFPRIPIVLCNAPITFQPFMMAIFARLVENIIEVFIDDFSIFGSSFEYCPHDLNHVLKRFRARNLVLNWEICHIMVTEGQGEDFHHRKTTSTKQCEGSLKLFKICQTL